VRTRWTGQRPHSDLLSRHAAGVGIDEDAKHGLPLIAELHEVPGDQCERSALGVRRFETREDRCVSWCSITVSNAHSLDVPEVCIDLDPRECRRPVGLVGGVGEAAGAQGGEVEWFELAARP
jgi:hypothetical protein